MTPEVKSRIFEPFYTAKEVGKGTGLGLSMVYGMVKKSGGVITDQSHRGAGTTSCVSIPEWTDQDATPSLSPLESTEAAHLRAAVVLVAEDDDRVWMLIHQIFAHEGYTLV